MDKCIDSDDIVYALAAFLSPKDLVYLALTCKSFGAASGKTPWSRMEELARRQVSAAKDDVSFKWRHSDLLTIDGQESWINVYNRLHLLRTSIIFHTLINNDISYVDRNITHIRAKKSRSRGAVVSSDYSYAICQQSMDFQKNSGRHFVQYRVTGQSSTIKLGIMRPIHSRRKRKMKIPEYCEFCNSQEDPAFTGLKHHCLFGDLISNGDDVYGLLIDLGSSHICVYQNYKLVNINYMRFANLEGQFCWAVGMKKDQHRVSVRIENNWQDTCGASGPTPKENWELWHNLYNSNS
ncbi:hypothetical protein QTG54_002808 [Skeletonema marinoi]|uniref:F-box domain-containing protein n=1 Tax=Skeletonema marinoi TaxID=267567 RepID=A0AAD9DFV9_9STRA|nr:hypothetical protein QTG54_002808 [Skeletonema marinoi]